MSGPTDGGHRSIGEVLRLLQEEFPDVTISKIRFLESQGLIAPERTPSGYRKFSVADVERLRTVLTLQRDQFLPLKVIRERLAAGETRGGADAPGEEAPEAEGAAVGGEGAGDPQPGATSPFEQPVSTATFTRDELAAAAGLAPEVVDELERFGLLASSPVGSVRYFDEESLVIVRAASALMPLGVEPRHLRMYKVAAEREAGFLEQLVTPLVHQRNPAARREAREVLVEATRAGERLRGALLRRALRHLLEP